MNAIPVGATATRLNTRKTQTNYFKTEGDTTYIWNKAWEVYTGNTSNLVPIGSTPPKAKNTVVKKREPAKKKVQPFHVYQPAEIQYDPIIPTFAEDVLETIPHPVLRQLLRHYKNADVVEVVINVKTTHTIKGDDYVS